jgi:chromosome segregation protein
VTVAGKGGRPKKWKSDADRVRAFRARQRSEAEPATLEQAVEQGDDFVEHVARIAELEVNVASGRRTASQLARVRQLDRENGEMQGRLERMQRELDAFREMNARLLQQRDQLVAALNAWAAPDGGAPTDDVAEQLSRSERRRRAREELRRRPR